MKSIIQVNRYTVWLFFLMGCIILFSSPPVVAHGSSLEMSVDEAVYTTGSIRKVSPEKNTITLKISKKERIRLLVTPATAFVGVKSFDELKRGQRLKVWYDLIGEENRAVKVEVRLETGC